MSDYEDHLSFIFSLCDHGSKGYLTSEDLLRVGPQYGDEMNRVLEILRLREGDRLTLNEFIRRVSNYDDDVIGGNDDDNDDDDDDDDDDDECFEGIGEFSSSSPVSCRSSSTTTSASTSSSASSSSGYESLVVDPEVKSSLHRIESQLRTFNSRNDLSMILDKLDETDVFRRRLEAQAAELADLKRKLRLISAENEKLKQDQRIEQDQRFLEERSAMLRLERESLIKEREDLRRERQDFENDKRRMMVTLTTRNSELGSFYRDSIDPGSSKVAVMKKKKKKELMVQFQENEKDPYRNREHFEKNRETRSPTANSFTLIRENAPQNIQQPLKSWTSSVIQSSSPSPSTPLHDERTEFENRCLSLIIEDLKNTNENLINNLRNLEEEDPKDNSKVRHSSDGEQLRNSKIKSFKSSKNFVKRISYFSKSMSSLNLI